MLLGNGPGSAIPDHNSCALPTTAELAKANLAQARVRSPISAPSFPAWPAWPGGPRPSFKQIMDAFCNFDINGDGLAEINSLTPMQVKPEPYSAQPNGVIIVFVERRLVVDNPATSTSATAMKLMLGLLGSDLFKDGYYPYFVTADVYAGTRHQDGRTLLAMRRFLQQVRRFYPLSATLLVGSFPDASIVRTVLVKNGASEFDAKSFTSGSAPFSGYTGYYLSVASEEITTRAEIVLGDLDGNWENLYREKLKAVDYEFLPHNRTSKFPFENEVDQAGTYNRYERCFDDVFHIVDHNVTVAADPSLFENTVSQEGAAQPAIAQAAGAQAVGVPAIGCSPLSLPQTLTFSLHSLTEPSPEATAADRQLPNRIARPEIVVGRINPRSIAVKPTAPISYDGAAPLNASGVPQRLTNIGFVSSVTWTRDPDLERRLIVDYIARAHKFRLGSDRSFPLRVSSIRGPDDGLTSPHSFNTLLRPAFGSLLPVQQTEFDDASSVDFVAWLKQPAVLRGIAAHSDRVNSQFEKYSSARDLEIAVGAPAFGEGSWRWVYKLNGATNTLTPSFANMPVDVNFHVYRSLWENKVLAGAAQMFIIHDGCEVMRFANSETLPYNDVNYGQVDSKGTVSNGESLMFYANGLGLMARNKVFNDTPVGFVEAVRASGGRFGYGWAGYLNAEAGNQGMDERAVDPTIPDRRYRTLQRKRSYFWNMIGDPTLKLRY
ncbi:MAG: hypothetical protein J7494_01420 [Sphingobium sp.]|nr:hypothetical protein [Sphingobium sp.]